MSLSEVFGSKLSIENLDSSFPFGLGSAANNGGGSKPASLADSEDSNGSRGSSPPTVSTHGPEFFTLLQAKVTSFEAGVGDCCAGFFGNSEPALVGPSSEVSKPRKILLFGSSEQAFLDKNAGAESSFVFKSLIAKSEPEGGNIRVAPTIHPNGNKSPRLSLSPLSSELVQPQSPLPPPDQPEVAPTEMTNLLSPSVISALSVKPTLIHSDGKRRRPPPLKQNSPNSLATLPDGTRPNLLSPPEDALAPGRKPATSLSVKIPRVHSGLAAPVTTVNFGDIKRSPKSPWSSKASPLSTIPEKHAENSPPTPVTALRTTKRPALAVHTVTIGRNGKRIETSKLDTLARSMSITSASIIRDMSFTTVRERSHSAGLDPTTAGNRMLTKLDHLVANNYLWQPSDWLRQNEDLILEIVAQVRAIVAEEPRLVRVPQPAYVLGDLHGNFCDLHTFGSCFWRQGVACSPANILFLGDYVDRRNFSLEVILYLFSLKLQCPPKVTLLRGNHELRDINMLFGFLDECCSKFGSDRGLKVWEMINDVFDCLPIAAVVNESVFCVHGGIPGPECVGDLAEIMRVPCPLRTDCESAVARDLLWSDPQDSDDPLDFVPNEDRGLSHKFSSWALERFLTRNNLDFIVRAHQYKVHLGFQVQKKGKLVTVFSTSAYCGGQNAASCVLVSDDKIRMLRLDSRTDFMMDRSLPRSASPEESTTTESVDLEAEEGLCQWCEERPKTIACSDCELVYCDICASSQHIKGSLQRHQLSAVGSN